VQNIRQRYKYSFILLKQLVKSDFKLRYQGSFLGYMWSLLRPLAIFAILYVVFTKFLKIGEGVPHYPIYLLLGIVIWNFFVEVTMGCVSVIVAKGDLIRKINFPKYVIILATSISALINLFLNLIIVFIFMYLNKVDVRMVALIFPLLLLELYVFSLALAFFLSAAFVRFRDISYIWEVFVQGAFYATPILYPLSLIPIAAAKIIMLNPLAQIIQDSRYVLVTEKTQTIATVYNNPNARIIPVSIVLISLCIASIYFRKRSMYFAEEV
jgi:ABC-2 type transport system permease protein